MSFERCAYAVFKGVGVAGIAHVGALAELQKRFQFVGFAGTSAGSLVALLAAAGLSADKIHSALRDMEMKSLVGPYRHLTWFVPWGLAVGLVSGFIWPISWALGWRPLPPGVGWVLVTTSILATLLAIYVGAMLGLVSTRRLRDFLIARVRVKIQSFDRQTTFHKFRQATGKALAVFTTDLSGKALQTFGQEQDDGQVSVIDAVVASAAFPLFFWPVNIRGRVMTDGGIACNLPVFAFDSELSLRRYPVIAFDLTWVKEPKKGRLWPVDFLVRLITTSVESHDAILESLTTRVSRLK